MSDLEQLKMMGFDAERANLALKSGGNLNGAIDWLEKNADKSIEDLKTEAAEATETDTKVTTTSLESGGVANSYVCGECGKKFRNMVEVQFHANKSGHAEISESTEEIAPLTEEEKKQKLEDLRQKLAEKRAQVSEQDKEEKKQNDKIRAMATKESQDIREKLAAAEQIKEAAKKRAEKKADVAARNKILAQIEQDKADRKKKAEAEKAAREGKAVPLPEAPKPIVAQKAGNHTEARLRLQTANGTVTKSFPVETTLFEVAHVLKEESGVEVSKFSTTFPTKSFEATEFGMTLKEAGMVPSAVVIVK